MVKHNGGARTMARVDEVDEVEETSDSKDKKYFTATLSKTDDAELMLVFQCQYRLR